MQRHRPSERVDAGAPLGNKEGLKLALTEEELAAIETLLAAHAAQAAAGGDARRLRSSASVNRAAGPRARRDHERTRHPDRQRRDARSGSARKQFERIYWGFGTHLGVGAVQSGNGDRLGYVQNSPKDEVKRGYRSLRELHMHTDSYEIVGLMCVRRAKSGGLSGLAPSLSIHNEILRTRPELLEPLYKGFRIASEEARFSSKAITDEAMPVFSYVDGKLSLHVRAVAHEERGGDAGRHAGGPRGGARRISTRSPTARTWRCASCSSPAT